jgi:purine catabolism regulator
MDKHSGAAVSPQQQIEIYRHLARLSADDQGIEQIAQAVADFANKAVLVQDKRLQPLAAIPSSELPNWHDILSALKAPECLPGVLHDRKLAHQVQEPLAQSLESYGRLILPVVTRGVARGYLSLIAPSPHFTARDRMILKQGALVCAIEMAKVKAVSVAEKKLRGDLIQAILANAIGEADALGWAERSGFRKSGPYAVVTMQWVGSDTPSLRRLETIVSGQLKRLRGRIMASARDDEMVVFYALTPDRELSEVEQWASGILGLASSEFPTETLAIGIGRTVPNLLDAGKSYAEASQAMKLEHRLKHKKPQVFANLGVYRLLLPLAEKGELRPFAEQMLGKLLRNEGSERGHLLETLNAYFRCNGNVMQTARVLFIHRNTLLYRLDRIRELGGFDLDDAETRLQLQLALRAHELTRQDF